MRGVKSYLLKSRNENHSTNQSTNRSPNQPTANRSRTNQPINHQINQSITKSTNQSPNQPINHQINQSVNQSVSDQSIINRPNKSVSWLFMADTHDSSNIRTTRYSKFAEIWKARKMADFVLLLTRRKESLPSVCFTNRGQQDWPAAYLLPGKTNCI